MFQVVSPSIVRSTYNCNTASGTGQTVSATFRYREGVPFQLLHDSDR